MFNLAKGPQPSGTSLQSGRYFKFQMSGWTEFDPMDKKLPEITEAIENGGGFVTAVEVLEVEADLAAIKDKEVREGFENILAARRVLLNLGELPKKILEDLHSALKAQAALEVDEKKPASSAGSQVASVVKQA